MAQPQDHPAANDNGGLPWTVQLWQQSYGQQAEAKAEQQPTPEPEPEPEVLAEPQEATK